MQIKQPEIYLQAERVHQWLNQPEGLIVHNYLQGLLSRYRGLLEDKQSNDFSFLKFYQGAIDGLKEFTELDRKLQSYLTDKREGKVS